ncbi:TlpA disulfide reductase family protein [Pedobacter sp. HDW13]|uniref:TlpA disulfide reductase family protein n=1 Tax=Pedobacter sp. HDW13 TaxID=2714940 RepID=UPI00198064DF|nr:TlpA disulfide reductase family protein [Pedobacter sp. HDW13]
MKINKILAIVGLFGFVSIAYGQTAQLKGNIRGLRDADLSISYYEGKEAKISKLKAEADQFTWKGNVSEAQRIMITFPKRKVWVYVEPGNMQLDGHIDSLSNIRLEGSKIQDEAEAYNKLLEPILSQAKRLFEKYGNVDKQEQLALEQRIQELNMQRQAIADSYITAHPQSAFSLTLVTDLATLGEYKDILKVYSQLGEDIKASQEGQRLSKRLAILKRSEIGSPVLNFTQSDNTGKQVTFSEFKGKYVFIDFWASWCGPCRAENPNVLKAYNKYKDKKFTIVGISLDDNEEKWKKAIEEDNIPWTQLSDLKGSKNEIAAYYGVMGYPVHCWSIRKEK